MLSAITPDILRHTLSWEPYYALIKQYIETDDKPEIYRPEKMLRYTAANLQRMDTIRSYITIESKLYNQLDTLATDWIWVVLAEPWCGDVSQILPVLYTIAGCSDHITFRILQSDSYPEVMDRYTTDGSRSIPILVCIDSQTGKEIGIWGPRPKVLQNMVKENKDRTDISFGDKVRMIHSWYEADKSRSIQEEFIDLIKIWKH
jgi:hypothetical protein